MPLIWKFLFMQEIKSNYFVMGWFLKGKKRMVCNFCKFDSSKYKKVFRFIETYDKFGKSLLDRFLCILTQITTEYLALGSYISLDLNSHKIFWSSQYTSIRDNTEKRYDNPDFCRRESQKTMWLGYILNKQYANVFREVDVWTHASMNGHNFTLLALYSHSPV